MEKLLCTAEEAATALGIGRTRVFDLIRTGVLDSVKIGTSRRILVESLSDYIKSLKQAA